VVLEEDALTIVLSPIQLAAVLVEESISETETLLNRLWGGTRVVGGIVELMGAGVLCAMPEPTLATKVGCVVVGAHGTDTLVAGLRQVSGGQREQGLTEQTARALAQRLGADDSAAATIGLTVDIAVAMPGAVLAGAARVAAVRAGQINLAAHEASVAGRLGGHTIARHVGKTAADLRTRLAANPRLSTVSSFSNLRVAEIAISKALRANAHRISTWARTASPGAKLELEYSVRTVIGQGVQRGSSSVTSLSGVRIVLRHQTFNGMPYYILTAFPI
jgi:hypothetical protein